VLVRVKFEAELTCLCPARLSSHKERQNGPVEAACNKGSIKGNVDSVPSSSPLRIGSTRRLVSIPLTAVGAAQEFPSGVKLIMLFR
jgi:hypothetical protein